MNITPAFCSTDIYDGTVSCKDKRILVQWAEHSRNMLKNIFVEVGGIEYSVVFSPEPRQRVTGDFFSVRLAYIKTKYKKHV